MSAGGWDITFFRYRRFDPGSGQRKDGYMTQSSGKFRPVQLLDLDLHHAGRARP
jgi:hypothetical protein